MPDTAQEVRAILSRTLRELDEAIGNPSVSSVLAGLGSLLGVDDGDSTATPAAQASPKRGSGASRRGQSAARGGPSASAARKSAPTPTRGRRSAPATDGSKPREAGKSSMAAARAAGETISSHSFAAAGRHPQPSGNTVWAEGLDQPVQRRATPPTGGAGPKRRARIASGRQGTEGIGARCSGSGN